MAQTFIVKGDVVTNPSDNDFGRAVFVRITATGDTTGQKDGKAELDLSQDGTADTMVGVDVNAGEPNS